MRVVLDTNILVSALLIQTGFPAAIYRAWSERQFTLLTCAEQLDELRDTLRKPRIAARIKPYMAGRLVNDIRAFAEIVDRLPKVQRRPIRQMIFSWHSAKEAKPNFSRRAIRVDCSPWGVTAPRGLYRLATSPRWSDN
jgi:predicted nucleic acid-binding protein